MWWKLTIANTLLLNHNLSFWLSILLLANVQLKYLCNATASPTLLSSQSESQNFQNFQDFQNLQNVENIKLNSPLAQNGEFFPSLEEFSEHKVIRPKIYHGRSKREIRSTLEKNVGIHVPEITLSYRHNGKNVYIDLIRNDNLLPEGHFVRYQNSKVTPDNSIVKTFNKTEYDLCQYQGSVRGKSKSIVALSTCNGVNGIVVDGMDTYFIHSGSDGRLQDDHFLFRHADLKYKNMTCGYSNDENHDINFLSEHLKKIATNDVNNVGQNMENYIYKNFEHSDVNRLPRSKRSYNENNNGIRGPYNANKHSSYVELVIVVDTKIYQGFNENQKKVHQYCKDVANIINALYMPLNIFVALIGVVIWTETNEIEFSSDGDVTLRNFLNYRKTRLVRDHPNDNAQLLTKEQFNGGVVGKALKGPICTHEFSGGVSMQHSQIVAVVATTMAHEMGHNFGMEHDTNDCKCQDEKCIMSASSTSVVPTHWSSCSIDQLNIAFSRGMNYCLRNKPTKLFESPQCGNGFVEPGEQCDCGLAHYCENFCCDPETCMLRANASCATGECCDLATCRPKGAGTACRAVDNECDLPEFCTGESEYCPADVFKRDTEKCDNGDAFCYEGNCRSHSNQCRILWGPTGESSHPCYIKNVEGKRVGNCGFDRLTNVFIPCEIENTKCGMLHCRHLNERLEFGLESAAVLSHWFTNYDNEIVPCRTALVDLGLQSTDPGLTPNGAKCGDNRMCVNQKCLTIHEVREKEIGKQCPDNCSGNGVCNSRGNCHCHIGFSGPSCLLPGYGGSVDSGPATNPNSHQAFQRFMYIFFFAVIPLTAAICFLLYYCRNNRFVLHGKFTDNILKSASSNKQPSSMRNNQESNGLQQQNSAMSLTKSTPSSTDDMNSALLKSPTDSSEAGMFGKFKGFTLRPLEANNPTNNLSGPNVAYVQPTVQDNSVPLRIAPSPPIKKINNIPKDNLIVNRKAPELPPPNPGSSARPLISMPVLETSTTTTTTLPLSNIKLRENSPIRTAPTVPSNLNIGNTLKPAPPPPIPLHTDPKMNIKRDGTIRRIASFLKKDDKSQMKEKTYIDRDKLRNLEISSPIPISQPQGESSNSDSETITSKEEETKNLVKRAQSCRSPVKKTNVQSFGSMRQPSNNSRPKSVVNSGASSTRPKSPPPRPPPVLKKASSVTSSGYQMPVSGVKKRVENTYDDCEFVESSLTSGGATENKSKKNTENIYSVIDEIPPASQTLKRSDFVNVNSIPTDMGLLGEIVHEIEKRNNTDSIYTASSLTKSHNLNNKEVLENSEEEEDEDEDEEEEVEAAGVLDNKSTPKLDTSSTAKDDTQLKSSTQHDLISPTTITTTQNANAYPRIAPVARVAPTRSDSVASGFSSFKPPVGVHKQNSLQNSNTLAPSSSSSSSSTSSSQTAIASNQNNESKSKTAPLVNKNKPKTTTPSIIQQQQTATTGKRPQPISATIQKPKPLSAKPSFSNNQKGVAGASIGVPRAAPTIKKGNIASLTKKFENGEEKS